MSLECLLEPTNFLGTRPSNLNVSNVEKSTAASQRQESVTPGRFLAVQFHNLGVPVVSVGIVPEAAT